jgi:hypothetical protein
MVRRDRSESVGGGEIGFTIDELPTRASHGRRARTLALFVQCGKSRGQHRNLD